ncbi:MAG: hypothetical protein B9S32_13225 [Verrucomicrobia bacterium Tous-C9LFEB]|nr:MAG: hypothetical protein B9S32_13225 [Verrucomicrobia bacterium Tous-C9LFEB]
MKTFRAKNLQEAVELAVKFKRQRKYNWFRGQSRDFPPSPSFGRLSKLEAKKSLKRFERFVCWLIQTPGLGCFRSNPDAPIAIAQHYGIPTGFLDFTTDPSVAGYFASWDKNKIDSSATSCIYCLNSKKITEQWALIKKIFRIIQNVNAST